MKTAKKIGIVCWSLFVLLLIAILVVGIVIGPQKIFNGVSLWSGNIVINTDNAKEVSTYSVPVKDFDNINIDWESGYVKFYIYEGDEIQLIERSRKKLDDKEKMTYKVENGTLEIESKSSFGIRFFYFGDTQKILEVKIPADKLSEINKVCTSTASADVFVNDIDFKKIEISTASGEVSMENIKSENINIDTTSGDILMSSLTVANSCSANSTSGCVSLKNSSMSDLETDTTSGDVTITSVNIKDSCSANSTSGYVSLIDCVSPSVETNTTSGDVKLDGEFSKVQCDTMSGDINISSKTVLTELSCNTTSGGTTVKIPTDTEEGFTANISTVSGDFICDLPVTSNGDKKIYGNGEYRYNFDSTSGNITIKTI